MTFQGKVMHSYVNFEAEVLKSYCEWEIMLQLEMQIEKKKWFFFYCVAEPAGSYM